MATTQQLIDHYFATSAAQWDELYSQPGLSGFIYQHRRRVALQWLLDLQLPQGAKIADIGCGAGCTTLPLAASGFQVAAIDRVSDMLRRVEQKAALSGVAGRINTFIGDAHSLNFESESFDVVLALGVIPWLDSPFRALTEFVRVLRPGGHVLVSSDNGMRLNFLFDPLDNPIITPLRRRVTRQLRRWGWVRPKNGVEVHMFSPRRFTRMLDAAGATPVRSSTIGFGPFTLFRKPLLPEGLGLQVASRLQSIADCGFPLLRFSGAHSLVLAQKSTFTN